MPPPPDPAGLPDPIARIEAARLAINAAWLAQLRWVALAGQLLTIAGVEWGLGIGLPVGPMLALAMVTAVTNAGYAAWLHHRRRRDAAPLRPRAWHMVLGLLMLMDLLVLSAMLSLTGGPTNPFTVFYFVNLALCGVLLPERWAWLLGAMAVFAFGAIGYRHLPIPVLREPDRLQSIAERGGLHVVGVGAFGAFGVCSVVIISFATRLTRELRHAQEARLLAEESRARSEKLEALGTLAAGAAHELATPLGAIAVAAGELQRDLDSADASPQAMDDARDDLRLIRDALARCRRILDRMATDSGQAAGEAPRRVAARELIDDVLGELADGHGVATRFEGGSAGRELLAPPTALAQAVRALVQNALDASPEGGVELRCDAATGGAPAAGAGMLRLQIIDRGAGMPPAVLARAAEPFYTTKEPGRGMGLGLYLARSVVERLGGSLDLESEPSQGTTVSVLLPLAEAAGQATAGRPRAGGAADSPGIDHAGSAQPASTPR
ncbi:MAG: ATP-binding protein [Planctomycetota bacterium]